METMTKGEARDLVREVVVCAVRFMAPEARAEFFANLRAEAVPIEDEVERLAMLRFFDEVEGLTRPLTRRDTNETCVAGVARDE
jgi:hypothetical protein